MVVQHWVLIISCWRYADRRLVKAIRTVQKQALSLAAAFRSRRRLCEVLRVIQRCLAVGCRINKRKTQPHTYQLLLGLDEGPISRHVLSGVGNREKLAA